MYHVCSSLITKRIQFVHHEMNIALPAYVQAAAERKSVGGYEGHVNPDRNRYTHAPGAKRIVSADIV
jgi:hypothetical protein